MSSSEIRWGGSGPVAPAVIADGVKWAREHGYPVYVWPDTNRAGQTVTLTRIMTPTGGESVALYETTGA